MLFGDPARVLAEMRRVLRPGGRFGCAVWAAAPQNPWASVVGRVFVERGLMEPPSPGAPGMFSLADTERLEALLARRRLRVGRDRGRARALPLRRLRRSTGRSRTSSAAASPTRLLRCSDDDRESVRQAVERGAESFRTEAGLEFPGLCHDAIAS